jgi:ankyrin repeat protein
VTRFLLCFVAALCLGRLEARAGESIYGINAQCDAIAGLGLGGDDQVGKVMADAVAKNDWELMRRMIGLGADPELARASPRYGDAKSERLNVELVAAAAAGDDAGVLAALQRGADVNFQANLFDIMSPLIWAAGCDHLVTVALLIDRGADVNIGSRYSAGPKGAVEGFTPLMHAAEYANDAIVELLLSKGADVNAQFFTILDVDRVPVTRLKWDTALLTAGSTAVTEILLRHNADPNIVRADGTSPLMNAAIYGNLAACKLLRAHGASPDLKNTEHETAADLARRHKHSDVAEMIERWSAGQPTP